MESKEFRHDSVIGYMTRVNGDALVIEGVKYLPEEIDFTDSNAVKILASRATHTANGIYDLIKRNCDISNPDISPKAHLEMYLALGGLACEIYMKSIIYNENLHNGKKATGHKLDDLFGQLPLGIQRIIVSKIINIEALLPSIKDMFTALRYDFENNHIQGEYLVVFDLMEELNKISNGYPTKATGALRYANGTLFLN